MVDDYAISNQHLVCKFEKMRWDMFLRKEKGNYFALPNKLIGGGDCNSIRMGLRGILICCFLNIETVFG